MATKIVTKNSSTASAVPTASDLVQGELAVNVADKRLFTEDNGGSVVELGTNPSTIDINAGTIDGAVIGGTTPAAITGSTVTSTGNIVVTGTVDGRDVATDGTKLDGIEASADVTDTTNVVASLTAGSNITIAADGTIASTASGGGGETLAQTLALGNTTGGTDLSVSSGDNIVMAASSTVDGRDVSVDGTKLDGIEASADVTDATNVTAAGALMDSEVTNLAQVKAFDSSDYATAAQGTTADAALPKTGGTVTGTVVADDIGIGITAPTQALHVVGDIVATGNITAYFSDERLKDFKGTIPNALDKVAQLNGYYYTPNETAQALGVDNNGVEVGVSAQEVEAVLPEIVTDSVVGKDYKTVMYEKLTPLLIESVKELTEKVKKLELKLTEMEK